MEATRSLLPRLKYLAHSHAGVCRSLCKNRKWDNIAIDDGNQHRQLQKEASLTRYRETSTMHMPTQAHEGMVQWLRYTILGYKNRARLSTRDLDALSIRLASR